MIKFNFAVGLRSDFFIIHFDVNTGLIRINFYIIFSCTVVVEPIAVNWSGSLFHDFRILETVDKMWLQSGLQQFFGFY